MQPPKYTYPKNRKYTWLPCGTQDCKGKITCRSKSGKCGKCMQAVYIKNWVENNPERFKAIQRKWVKANPEPCRVRSREYQRRNAKHLIPAKHGLRESDYQVMFEAQSGLCKICTEPAVGRLCIDHCHTTGKIRGLLCRQCNFMLGNAKDKISILMAGIEYLKENS